MKIGIIKDDIGYGRWGELSYKKLKEHGFSCADYQMSDTNGRIYNAPENEVENELRHERKLAEEAGVKIWQVHGPWVWPIPETIVENRKKHFENLKKSIRYTSLLGCENWVIHPLMPYGREDSEHSEETWKMNVEWFGELAKFAKEFGVTICVENLPFKDFSISKPSDILRLVKAINDDNFKACLDIGHVGYFEGMSAGDAVRLLGKELKTLHVHDTRPGMDIHLMPYFGIIDWSDFILALKEIEFDGVFSLETPPRRNLDTPIFEIISKSLAEIAEEMSKNI